MKELYRRMMDRMEPPRALVTRTRARMGRRFPGTRRILSVALAVTACAVVSVSVLGAAIPSFNRLLAAVAPEYARFLRPVELSCEDNGIRMEVVAAMNDGDSALVFITLQDLREDRLDETLELWDYSVTGAGGMETEDGMYELTAYDAATKTATLKIMPFEESAMWGDSATLHLRSFVKRREYEDVPIPMDWEVEPETIPLKEEAVSGSGWSNEPIADIGKLRVLKPAPVGKPIRDDVDFARITGMGFVDGLFHIQVEFDKGLDNTVNISLDDQWGGLDDLEVIFGVADGETVYGGRYKEFVFPVSSKSRLETCTLLGYFSKVDSVTEGNWRITFPLQPADTSSITLRDLDINGKRIDELTVTPMGLLVTSPASDYFSFDLYSDGERISFGHSTREGDSANPDAKVQGKWIPNVPIDFSRENILNIDGVEIPLEPQE